MSQPTLTLMLDDFQEALHTLLNGHITAGGANVPVLDDIPPNTDLPYVEIGDFAWEDWSTKTNAGIRLTVPLRCWSDRTTGTRGMTVINQVLQSLTTRITGSALTLTGYVLHPVRRTGGSTSRSEDGSIRFGELRFTWDIEQE